MPILKFGHFATVPVWFVFSKNPLIRRMAQVPEHKTWSVNWEPRRRWRSWLLHFHLRQPLPTKPMWPGDSYFASKVAQDIDEGNYIPRIRTPNAMWGPTDEGTQGLSVLAREFFYVETLKGFSQFHFVWIFPFTDRRCQILKENLAIFFVQKNGKMVFCLHL